jgi:hypothetical protein
MPRPDIKVRLALDEEAPAVELLVANIFDMKGWDLKFEKIFPHWLVAEIAGEIVGTINVRLSHPISSIEMLAMDLKLSKIERSTVTMLLLDSAMVIAGAFGAEGISSMIPDTMESYREVMEDKGYVIGSQGSIIFGKMR